jgi:hypothetical protein
MSYREGTWKKATMVNIQAITPDDREKRCNILGQSLTGLRFEPGTSQMMISWVRTGVGYVYRQHCSPYDRNTSTVAPSPCGWTCFGSRPSLWSSGQSSWLQIFWEVVDVERGPLSLVRINEELLEWKNSGSLSRKSRLTAVGIRCADHATPSIRKGWH